MTLFISIALAMFAGVLLTRVTKLFNMPDVTAYLIAGILIGPTITKIALTRSGDIQPKSEEVLNRREKTLQDIKDKRSKI